MSEYEKDTISTVELALAVEGMTRDDRIQYFGVPDTVGIFTTYTKARIRTVVDAMAEGRI